MSVTQRAGRWTLGEKTDGVFIVKKGGQYEAKILTDRYDPEPEEDERSVLSTLIEVQDSRAAREAFHEYVRTESRLVPSRE
ncbi:hypothetical protein [Salarchaeum japonicum]|uniref:Uncharacterized protein n=1 Tax=Salarchaeum japonicum TaxID=555573 RepID=A0AAV3T5V7_9EURY|nr:hypothetical protein [Salarchaeum japonicum]